MVKDAPSPQVFQSEYQFSFIPSSDYDTLEAIAQHPRLYKNQVSDFSPSREDFRIPRDPSLLYIEVRERDEILGYWCFVKHSPILWEVYMCMLPKSWGEPNIEASKGMLAWIWKNSSCTRLIAQFPAYNQGAIKLVERMGMKQWGLNPDSWMKDQKLWGTVWMGISKITPALLGTI